MNGIEKITARIDAQTQEEIDRLLADAKEQAAQITAQYRAQAETERASLTARSEKAAQEREERLISGPMSWLSRRSAPFPRSGTQLF